MFNPAAEEIKMAYFNYRNLDPTEFEALAKDVMERRLGRRLFRYAQGQDGGIDLCDDISKKHIVVQCKRYQQGSFDNLYGVLKREEKPKIDKLIPRPDKYYVFTSLDLLPGQKKIILDLFREYMADESCIVDGIAINDFFRDERNHDLISRNIKLFISFPDNYQYSPADHSQLEKNKLYDHLLEIFENDRKNHPSIRMMDPDPSLFPKGLPEVLSDGRYAKERDESPRTIRDMIRDSWNRKEQRHILLVGEGGIGKTVAMLTLPEEDWFKNLRIPVIYVPLQRLDVFKGDLNRYIREKIGDNHYTRCVELANSIPKGHPKLLLLLDGFNEIPDSYKKEAEKYLREWIEKPGIQIITTSRMGFFLENRFSKYQLQPLPYETVRSFLVSAGIVEEHLPAISVVSEHCLFMSSGTEEEHLPDRNDRIWEVINVPLMLTMYTQIEKVIAEADRSSTSSLLRWKTPENAAHIIWDYLQMELYRCIEKEDSSYSAAQYAVAILAIAPYICCQMSHRNRYYIKRNEFHALIRDALVFYAAHQDLLDGQILNVCTAFNTYHPEDLFREESADEYTNIIIDNIGLFQTQKIRKAELQKDAADEYTCSLMHQNFRDALASVFICSCLPKIHDAKEKKELLAPADYYVKNYMAEHLSGQELLSIWEQHRKEDPEEGQITYVLMDLIGRQRKYDYRELDFGGLDLTRTNLNELLSRRIDICPLPGDRDKFRETKISVDCFSPGRYTGLVRDIAFSPDGRLLASASSDSTVPIWNLESGERRILKSHAGYANTVAFSPDGSLLAIGTISGPVLLWNLESGKRLKLKGHKGCINSIAFSPDGRMLASGSNDETVRIWNLENGKVSILSLYAGDVNSVSFNYDGKQIASGTSGGTIRLWNLDCMDSRVLADNMTDIYSIAFSPDGKLLASGALDGTVRTWNLESGQNRVLGDHTDSLSYPVYSVAFSPDGRQLASGAFDGALRVWDVESGEDHILGNHAGPIKRVAFSTNERLLVSCSDDGTVRVWNLENNTSRILDGIGCTINSLAFSPDGKLLTSGSSDMTVRVWKLESRNHHVLGGHTSEVRCVSFSPDGSLLASSALDGSVKVWHPETGMSIATNAPAGQVNNIAFSLDGQLRGSAAKDQLIQVFEMRDTILDTFSPSVRYQTISINKETFSPDGRLFAKVAINGAIWIKNLESGKTLILKSHARDIRSLAFSPDGRLLACGIQDDLVEVWNLEREESRILKGHVKWVSSVAFSPDGRQLASGSLDRTVRVWDLKSGKKHLLVGHAGWISSVAFSPDGKLLASGANDGTVRVWNLETYQETEKYALISHVNLNGANFELAIIDRKDKDMLSAAGAIVIIKAKAFRRIFAAIKVLYNKAAISLRRLCTISVKSTFTDKR